MTNLFGEDTTICKEVVHRKKKYKQSTLHDYFQINVYGKMRSRNRS